MLELLDQTDKVVFQVINGIGNSYLDPLMILLSQKWIWIPLYLFLIFNFVKEFEHRFWVFILAVLAVVLFADQTTSGFMKPFFERLRPCKDDSFSHLVRIVAGCGGKFGFASSHAANTMGIAVITYLSVRRDWTKWLILWASFVGLSRVYLGVHYPGDVLAGFMVGLTGAILAHLVVTKWVLVRN